MTNYDTLRERLRERVTESDYGVGECLNCLATLTADDVQAGECTQCGSGIESDNEDLEDE